MYISKYVKLLIDYLNIEYIVLIFINSQVKKINISRINKSHTCIY